jgi:hypothetical protein
MKIEWTGLTGFETGFTGLKQNLKKTVLRGNAVLLSAVATNAQKQDKKS